MMIEAGTPLPDTAILLGHTSFDMTLQVYTHSVLRPASRHAFVEKMAARMAASQSPGTALLSAPTEHTL